MNRAAILFVLCCCSLAFAAISFTATRAAAADAVPGTGPAAKPGEAKTAPEDSLGRGTPYGTVLGFLRAVNTGDYEIASRYLEGQQSDQKKVELAYSLSLVLNRGLKIGLDQLSRAPEGHPNDSPDADLEKIGTATDGHDKLDIVLRRVSRPDLPPIWLFCAETLVGASAAADRLALAPGEAIWPAWFREITVLSYPVFLIVNILIVIPLLLVIAWLLVHPVLRYLRPALLRRDYGETALAQLRPLLFILFFSILLRFVAGHATTVATRLFFASLATVLLVIALSGLVVRLTRLETRSKVIRLQRESMTSSIAAAELWSWVVVCACVVVGLFLVLRSLGVEVTPAMAGLGVGGIALAFAAQKTLENLFGTVTIVTDKSIHVGDHCQAGSTEGWVESIGLRSTRIRTAERILVAIPNGQLAGMTLGNLTQRDKFLFRHNIRLRHDTTADQLRQVLSGIREMMGEHPHLEPSTIRTRLVQFGDYSIDLETFAYVLTRDAQVFLEIQENLLLRIMDIVEAAGTSVALPYSTMPPTENLVLDVTPRGAAAPGSPARARTPS